MEQKQEYTTSIEMDELWLTRITMCVLKPVPGRSARLRKASNAISAPLKQARWPLWELVFIQGW